MQVLKFGAIAVSDAARLRDLTNIVAMAREDDPAQVVVCTALPGVTNELIAVARAAAHGKDTEIETARRDLWSRHRAIAEKLVRDEWERESLYHAWADLLRVFDRVTRAVATLGDPSPRAIDAVAALGERFISYLVAVVLRQNGVPAREIDATELIITNDHYGAAVPFPAESTERIRTRIAPMGQAGIIPVVTGYIGATRQGVVTTLGRGGGDYTAALIGAALGADEVTLWTDVAGILTADPKIVPAARTLSNLSYTEAAEIAAYGPEVLHPRTIEPVANRDTTLRIRSILQPQQPGTRITSHPPEPAQGARTIVSARELSRSTILAANATGWAPDQAARTLSELSVAGVEVLTMAQSFSERSFSLVVRAADEDFTRECLSDVFATQLETRAVHQLQPSDAVALVTIIAAPNSEDLIPRVLQTLGQVHSRPLAITSHAANSHVTLLLPDSEIDQVLPALHQQLGLDNPQ